MKVLFISHAATISGAPISLRILIRHFIEKHGWEARILVAKKGPLLEEYEKLAPTNVFYEKYMKPFGRKESRSINRFGQKIKKLKHRFFPGELKKRQLKHEEDLAKAYREWKPDVVYSNTALNGTIIRKLGLDVPIVVHVRELAVSFTLVTGEDLIAFKEDPKYYFAVSGAVKEYLSKTHSLDSGRIKIAPVALESSTVKSEVEKGPPRDQIRSEFGAAPEDLVIGGVGYVHPRKGADLFLQTALEMLGSRMDPKLLFVWLGNGPDLKAHRQTVRDHDLENRIRFLGEKKEVYPWINSFDILLTPSRDDPFPRANLEAGCLGIPGICFGESGGSKEFFEEDAGIVLPTVGVKPLVEATEKLVSDAHLRRKLGDRARQKVMERYDVAVVGHQIAEFLRLTL